MVEPSYWIWLQQGLGYASLAVGKILDRGITPDEIYKMDCDDLADLSMFSAKEIMKLKMTSLDEAKKICDDCDKKYYKILTPDMKLYPERMMNLEDPPAVLYAQGNVDTLKDLDETPTVAMIGSRNMSSYGSRVATNLSYDLAKGGFTIVSGLALGIDAQAHTGALRADGKTIAILGCGLDVNYPAKNNELRKSIVKNGVVLTEYPPEIPAFQSNFPVRNRIISGISLGVIVVEANKFSGSLITVGHALQQGRDVFAVPTDIYDPNGGGVIKLIQDGAKPIISAFDVMSEYIAMYPQKISEKKMTDTTVTEKMVKAKKLEPERTSVKLIRSTENNTKSLTQSQKKIYSFLGEDPVSIEILAEKSGFAISLILSIMTELEISGLIKAYPGKRFGI